MRAGDEARDGVKGRVETQAPGAMLLASQCAEHNICCAVAAQMLEVLRFPMSINARFGISIIIKMSSIWLCRVAPRRWSYRSTARRGAGSQPQAPAGAGQLRSARNGFAFCCYFQVAGDPQPCHRPLCLSCAFPATAGHEGGAEHNSLVAAAAGKAQPEAVPEEKQARIFSTAKAAAQGHTSPAMIDVAEIAMLADLNVWSSSKLTSDESCEEREERLSCLCILVEVGVKMCAQNLLTNSSAAYV